MIINSVNDRKCANEENITSNLSRHLNTKKLKFQIMSFSEEQVIRICDTAIGDRVKIKEKVRENHRGKLGN